ncbi:MAG: hypothetical protein J1F64_01695 [Oscillospiraceae bacterium]|nr:hypothetical protein [Oscillospiraceae bacterium]
MARGARVVSENGMYHVLLRSTGKVFDTDSDYRRFIAIMTSCFSKYGGLLGYALLPGRVHMIVLDKENKLSTVVRVITAKYSRYKKTSVFYDRFKCEPVADNTTLAELIEFINSPPMLSERQPAYCSGADNECEKCPLDTAELEKRKAKAETFRMFMDDYKNMDDEEIGRFIKLLTGIDAGGIKNLADRRECIALLMRDRRISARRLAGILGISRNCFSPDGTNDEKDRDRNEDRNKDKNENYKGPEKNPQTGGRDLDVWLL